MTPTLSCYEMSASNEGVYANIYICIYSAIDNSIGECKRQVAHVYAQIDDMTRSCQQSSNRGIRTGKPTTGLGTHIGAE
jgi:hypothetical protein